MPKRRFLSPVGTREERLSGQIWPGAWQDATGFGRNTHPEYTLGKHTGADLNLNVPRFNADKNMPVYAVGPGTVIYARLGPGDSWGNIVVVDHGLVDGLPCYTRYAHGTNIGVHVGQQVDEWARLLDISNAEGFYGTGDHLHFDVSVTRVLATQAWHWPGWNLELLETNYRDPKDWLSREHIVGDLMPEQLVVSTPSGLPLLNEPPVPQGAQVTGNEETAIRGTAIYRSVTVGEITGWMLAQDGSTKYLSPIVETRQMRVIGNGLRRRNGPGTTFTVVPPAYNQGAIITVSGTFPGTGSTKGWTQIIENGVPSGLYTSLDFLDPN